ncbi:MAG TPA: toast rack family protein [Candidatus Aquilonibacter sp.]|nr:toast rack family protein [Candidatus Aquilonibacter sp.]
MASAPIPPRRSFVGPVILICIGVFFLVANLVPSFDPWLILTRYWPVILILIGLGKVWDYYAARRYDGAPGASDVSGVLIAIVLLMLLLGLGLWRHGEHRSYKEQQSTQTVDLQGASGVTANLEIPAGELNVSGGSDHLVDADYHYDDSESAPKLNYAVEDGHGQLTFNGNGDEPSFGDHDNRWTFHFNDTVPLDITLQMGAGQSNLDFSKVNVTHLDVHMGVGQMMLDLTGPRKQDVSADIQGGIGQARIRLPSDVAVRVEASGGIGSINVTGLTKQGDEYVNAAYGKTTATIDLTVHGGIGEIDLNDQ